MNRRDVLKTGMAASVLGAADLRANTMAESNHYYELRTYQLRNDLQPARLNEYFQQHFLPMAKRQGIGPFGFFNVISGQFTPSLIVVVDYKSMAELQAAQERIVNDKEFVKAWQAFDAAGELPYVRYEKELLKAFDKHPQMELPPTDEKRAARVFELRTYESKNMFSLRNKIDMFNQEEIKIFRDCGFAPVFFGEAVFGTRMPKLTYLVGFDNMAARDKAWDTFRANPDWARIRNKPGWTDPEAVTNIHGSFIRPTNYSQVR
jgi:hypothetical protein